MKWDEYQGLQFDRQENGVLLVTIRGSGRLNSLNEREHAELSQVWLDIDADPSVRVAVLTGAGDAFCAGGNIEMERRIAGDHDLARETLRDARNLVNNIVNCEALTVSAINGPAAGGGLVAALLCDISIVDAETRFTDGHVRVGLSAGDHACLIWPLLCGMARAKYYLLTGDFISGAEAAAMGMVSKATTRDRVLADALEVADRLARGPREALRSTKRSLNHWVRQAAPIYESSQALEILDLFSPDFIEGLDAFTEKRPPVFPSAQQDPRRFI
jgi:enoyl-CoA hydratase